MRASVATRLGWAQELAAVALMVGSLAFAVGPFDPTQASAWIRAMMPIVLFGYSTLGMLLLARRPANPIGWILCWTGLAGLLGQFSLYYSDRALTDQAAEWPASSLVAWLAFWTQPAAALPLLTFGFLLFPDGRLPSPRWRPLAWIAAAAAAGLTLAYAFVPGPFPSMPWSVRNPFGVEAIPFAAFTVLSEVIFALSLGCILASVISMPVRLRGLQGAQRRQLAWVIAAAALVGVTTVASGLLNWLADVDISALAPLGLAAFLVAFGVAIFRHRLYDSDIVLWRIVVLATVAGFTTVMYVAVVAGIGSALPVAWQENFILPTAATALVAVVAQPVLRWARGVASRLVYGAPATPYGVLSLFSRHVGHSLDQVLPQMARMLAESLGAAQAAVWLVVGDELRCAASWPARQGATAIALDGENSPDIPGSTQTAAVRHHGQLLGVFSITKVPGELLLTVERALLADLAAQAGPALRNVQLMEELKASRQRIIAAQDGEQRRIERDIHDGAQQRLVALALALRVARTQTALPSALRAGLAKAEDELRSAMAELQDLARGIHPAILTDEGLGPAISWLAELSVIATTVASVPHVRLPSTVETTACSIVSHTLAAAASANASRATITASYIDNCLTIEVKHDGITGSVGAQITGSIIDRVSALDGQLEVEKLAGGLSLVRALIPSEPLRNPRPAGHARPSHERGARVAERRESGERALGAVASRASVVE